MAIDRDKLQINEKDFMVDCVETAALIIKVNVYGAKDGKTVVVDPENRARLITKMAIAFYRNG